MQGVFLPKEKMIDLATAVRDIVADLLFPKTCAGCGREGMFLCDTCSRAIQEKRERDCPFCRNRTPLGATCLSCSGRHALDGLFAATSFRGNRTAENAIHIMKYEFVAELGDPLGRFLASIVSRSELPLPDFLVPVPLHPWRFRFRGFNQASLIARSLSEHLAPDLGIPVHEDILFRTRFTLPQARSHGAKERKENLCGAFSLAKDRAVRNTLRGKTIWLVDDVATTGTTLETCAKILKKAGVKKVIGIVVAR
ncbi:MAG: ComF family protein [Candidatus Moranbacteria bacterium]|nr:ComF family protein [Candidatus Moranbacteria bacterium]